MDFNILILLLRKLIYTKENKLIKSKYNLSKYVSINLHSQHHYAFILNISYLLKVLDIRYLLYIVILLLLIILYLLYLLLITSLYFY